MHGVAGRFQGLAIHDLDEAGVPRGADRIWRQQTAELWLVCISYLSERRDVLLCGQLPNGELLACPSADDYGDEIASCLLDCHDHVARGQAVARRADRHDRHRPGSDGGARHRVDPARPREIPV